MPRVLVRSKAYALLTYQESRSNDANSVTVTSMPQPRVQAIKTRTV